MARMAWFRSVKYKGPFEAKELGDGSIVECVKHEASDQYLLTRVYPWGFQQNIVFRMLPNGETKYISIGDGPEANAKRPEDQIGHPDYRAPHAITAAVPGNKPGDNYDAATRTTYSSRAHFEEEYARMKLAKVMQSDHSTMHTPSDPSVSTNGVNIQSFNVRAEGFSDVPTSR